MSNIELSGTVYVNGSPIGRIVETTTSFDSYLNREIIFIRLDNGSLIRDPRLESYKFTSEIKQD